MQWCPLRKKPCINHSGKFLTDPVFLHVEEIAYHVEEKTEAEIWVGGSSRRNKMRRNLASGWQADAVSLLV